MPNMKWYKDYLEEYFPTFTKLVKDKKVFKKLKSMNIDPNKSYYVYSRDREVLESFVVMHLIQKVSLFKTYDAYGFANTLTTEDFNSIVDSEVVILDYHEHTKEMGDTTLWLNETIIGKIADRRRKGLITIVMAGKENNCIKNSGMLTPLNLSSLTFSSARIKSNNDSSVEVINTQSTCEDEDR